MTLTKPLSRHDLSRTDRCISLRDRTKKAEPLTRAARRAQRVQDRPRRRRRSGRSCATERSEGAPVLAQRPAALARSSCKLCEAQRAEHRLWMEAPTSSPLRSRSRLRRRLQSVSCCAVALCDPQSSNGSEFKSSHSLDRAARWPLPVASERREPQAPAVYLTTGLFPLCSCSRFAPQALASPSLRRRALRLGIITLPWRLIEHTGLSPPVASEQREPRAPVVDRATVLLPLRSRD